MKVPLLIGVLCLSLSAMAGTKTDVKSTIKEVTVFLSGAQVKRTATAQLKSGRNELHFTGLPLDLDKNSLQFNANAAVTILNINYQVGYIDESLKDSAKVRQLENQLKAQNIRLQKNDINVQVFQNEKGILLKNTQFGGSQNGTSVIELERGVNLVRSRLLELNKKLLDLQLEKDALNLNIQKIRNQLEEYRRKSAVKSGEVVVVLSAEQNSEAQLSLNYTVKKAGWKPYYDLRVKSAGEPLKMVYKAKVIQTTGEDWNKVKVNLSTGDPSQGGNMPILKPWFLNFTNRRYSGNKPKPNFSNPGITGNISGIVINKNTGEAVAFANIVAKNALGEIVKGTTTDFDGKFTMNLNRPANQLAISFIGFDNQQIPLNNNSRFYRVELGETRQRLAEISVQNESYFSAYDAPLLQTEDLSPVTVSAQRIQKNEPIQIHKISRKMEQKEVYKPFIISHNPTTLNFSVNEKYSIPADGNDYLVSLKEYDLTADYLYKATPKLEEVAYLTASLTKWEDLSLQNGSAGIYYEGVYMGETYLDVDGSGNTLNISLGKDDNVVIKREKVQSKENKRFISGNKRESFHYRIAVRNNKQHNVKLKIYDQYPISANDQIKVKQEGHDKGVIDHESGLIEWKFELNPTDEKELNLKYEVTYPKDKIINLY